MIDQEKIHQQCFSKDPRERINALRQLIKDFSSLSDKQQAWEDLHKLVEDEDYSLRPEAINALRLVFSHVPDKQQAWNDLHRLANDQEFWVRYWISESLGSIFSDLPDKQQAWSDLIQLAQDEDASVRCHTVFLLGSACSHLADKKQAWNDLHRLTNDQDSWVRLNAAEALGHIFSDVPDKYQVFKDLIKLNKDEDVWVRIYANYSLGKVCIFDASQAENEKDYKSELENAIEFFEKASRESSFSSLIKFNKVSQKGNCSVSYHWGTPSQFCLPFYRSFHTIIFKKRDAKEEVDKYLEEAKSAIEGSKSKELLFEAIENLANALKEVQNMDNLDLEAKKGELKFYRQYCDRAAELMKYTEKTAPFATIAMRKGLPILDRNLKELLEEIQKKAKIACKESKGTDTEEIACAINREIQKWEIGSQEEMTQNIEGLIETFRMRIPHLPGYEHIFEEIEGIRDVNDLAKQYKIVSRLIGLIPIFSSMPDYVVQDIKEIKEKTTSTSKEVKHLQLSVDRLIELVNELQNPQEHLDIIQRNLEEIKNEIPEMREKIDEVLYDLYTPLSTTQKLKIAIPIIPLLVSYEQETDVPRFVADRICELKNLVLRKRGK